MLQFIKAQFAIRVRCTEKIQSEIVKNAKQVHLKVNANSIFWPVYDL